jgi:hypothetical protein
MSADGERRQPDSPRARIDEGYAAWVHLMWEHRKGILALAMMLASALTYVATTAGYRWVGPPQQLAAYRQERARMDTAQARIDTAIALRLASLEVQAKAFTESLSVLRADMRLSTFIQCVQLRAIGSDLLPPGCTPILRRGGQP